MAENPHLKLKIAGTDVQGESTQMPKDKTIECYSFSFGVSNPIDGHTGAASGRRQYQSIAISKRVDKASPLLFKALCTNQAVEGVFKFYRPNIKGEKNTEHYYTIEFKNARVESQSMSSGGDIPMEQITFNFRTITATVVEGGASHTDDWQHQG